MLDFVKPPLKLVYQGIGTGAIVQFIYRFLWWLQCHKPRDKISFHGKVLSNWHAKRQDKSNNLILRIYELFKTEFKWEDHLDGVENSKSCKVSTKYRTNFHTLESNVNKSHHLSRAMKVSCMPCIRKQDLFLVMLSHTCSRTSVTTSLIESKLNNPISAIIATEKDFFSYCKT